MTVDMFKYLMSKKVPMVKNMTTNEWHKIFITKKGKFFRANGKIISANAMRFMIKEGIV